MVGARIGFFRGDVKELVNDIQALKPTVFVSVPRLLNRVYDKVGGCLMINPLSSAGLTPSPLPWCQVIAGVSASPVKKWLFQKAMAAKRSEVER